MADNNSVSLVKFMTGEEVFCKLKLSENQKEIYINFPVVAVRAEDGIMYYPWVNAEENKDPDAYITINPASIITICTPVAEVVKTYNEFKDKVFSKIIKPTLEEQNMVASMKQ